MALCLGTHGDPRGMSVSCERGTPVLATYLYLRLVAMDWEGSCREARGEGQNSTRQSGGEVHTGVPRSQENATP